ncbi:hypothetical protein B296_00018137 [Ensete ventricosum]|uniref:Uncharacterized protein n=1 Tax=Ensete ventricosum TaxID=4639 RepID=A0A427A1V6_ENSVE|nr:hypothetical protein B296_00018137 [Ensete ventricosum]
MIRATGELDYFSAYILLREPVSQRTRPKLLGEHRGVEVDDRKGQGSDDESEGPQLPKSKALVRKEVDSKECHSVVEVDLPIAKKGMQIQGNG